MTTLFVLRRKIGFVALFSLVLALLPSGPQVQKARATAGTGAITIVQSGGTSDGTDWTFSSGTITTVDADPASINASDVVGYLNSGNLTIDAAQITILDDVVATTNSYSLSLESQGAIILGQRDGSGATLSTGGGDIIVWANKSGGSSGNIAIHQDSSLDSNGGHIWMGGGSSSLSWNSLTVGNSGAMPAQVFISGLNSGNQSITAGVFIQDSSIESSGGDIHIEGANYSGVRAVVTIGPVTINAGNGSVEIQAIVQSGNATAAGAFGAGWTHTSGTPSRNGNLRIISNKTTYPAILINADASQSASDTNSAPNDFYDEGTGMSGTVSLISTGGGGIEYNSLGSLNRPSAYGLRLGYSSSEGGQLNLLASSGSVLLNTGNRKINLANNNTNTALGAKAGSDVTSATSNLRLVTADLGASGALNFNTCGTITIEPPSGGSFSSPVNTDLLNYDSCATGLTIGNATNMANINVNSAISITGPVTLNSGGSINQTQPIAGSSVSVPRGTSNLTDVTENSPPSSGAGDSSGGTSRSLPIPSPAVVAPKPVPGFTPIAPVVPNTDPVAKPVERLGFVFDPNAPSRATVGGAPANLVKTPAGSKELSIAAGAFQFGVSLAGAEGGEVQTDTPSQSPELFVPRGQLAAVTGQGSYPGSFVQLFLPGNGNDSRELARIPVRSDGTFASDLSFEAGALELPVPIGRQVLQVVGYDELGNQTVVDMTVNIGQGVPAPEPNRQAGALPALSAGQSLATSGGIPETVSVTGVPEAGNVVVEGSGWVISVNADRDNGTVENADGNVLVRLNPSSVGTTFGNGFLPGTLATVWLFSEPTLMTTVTVNENGEFSAQFLVDSRLIAPGEHTLQVQVVGSDGYIKAANLGVLVEEPVEVTAESASGLLWWVIGFFVLALLLFFFLLARRRRRKA